MPYTATCAVEDSGLKRASSIREKASELKKEIIKNQAIETRCKEEIKEVLQREKIAKEEQKQIREKLLDLQEDLDRIESKIGRDAQRRHSLSRRFEENISIKKDLEKRALKVDFVMYAKQISDYKAKVPIWDTKVKELRRREEELLNKIERAERRKYRAEDKAAVLENKLEFAQRAKAQGVRTNYFDSPQPKSDYDKAIDCLQQRVRDKCLHGVLMEKKAKVLEKKVDSLEETIDMIKFRIKDFYNSKREVLSSKYL